MAGLYNTEIQKKKDKYNIQIQINNKLDVAVQVYQKKDTKGKSSQPEVADKKLTGSKKQD